MLEDHERNLVEELSSGPERERHRWRPQRRLVLLGAAAAAVAAAIGIGVRLELAHQRHLTLLNREDRVDVAVSFGGSDATSSSARPPLSAEVDVQLENHGSYPVSIQGARLQLPGVTGTRWSAASRRVLPGEMATLQLQYDVRCPVTSGPMPPGRLLVDVRSAAGHVHELDTRLLATNDLDDPITGQLRAACGALSFGEAVTLETMRTAIGSAVVLLHNNGRSSMQVRGIGVDDSRYSVTAQPALPLTIPPRSQRRVVLTFHVRSCRGSRPSNPPSLYIRGVNGEPGTTGGDAGYSDDEIDRVLSRATNRACTH